MAIGTGFKQQCPSCEAMVQIKDASAIGKKVDCPQCKYRFVVEAPGEGETAAATAIKSASAAAAGAQTDDDSTSEPIQEKAKSKGGGKAAKSAKAKSPVAAETSEETATKVPAALKQKKKLILGLGLAGIGVAVLVVAAVLILGKKPPTATSVPVPIVAKGPASASTTANDPVKVAPANEEAKEKKEAEKAREKKDANPPRESPFLGVIKPEQAKELTNLLPNDTQHVFHAYPRNIFHASSFEKHNFFYDSLVFKPDDPLAFSDVEFRQRVGFKVFAIDDLIRAENFTEPWTWTLVHTAWGIEKDEVIRALDLQEVPGKIRDQTYYVTKRPLPWLTELSRLSLGSPEHLVSLRETQKDRPLYVRFHDAQTIIFADEGPLQKFLRNGEKFRFQTLMTDKKVDKKPETPPKGKPGKFPGGPKLPRNLGGGIEPMASLEPQPPQTSAPQTPPGGQPPKGLPQKDGPQKGAPTKPAKPAQPEADEDEYAAPSSGLGGNTYMTIDPSLKFLLDRLEIRPKGTQDKIWFSAATDMTAARARPKNSSYQEELLWYFRQFWDITGLLQEKKSRILYLGATLYQRDVKRYRYKNEVICSTSEEARALARDLTNEGAARLVKFFDRALDRHKVELFARQDESGPALKTPGTQPAKTFNPRINKRNIEDPDMQVPGGAPPGAAPGFPKGPPAGQNVAGGPGGPGQANPNIPAEDEEFANSRLILTSKDDHAEFTLEVLLDQSALYDFAVPFVQSLKTQMDLALARDDRQRLGQAVKELGTNGLTERGVPPGSYPPGAFKRPDVFRSGRDPGQRVSWMAALLPYLGRQELYNRIDFERSWRDPKNWLPGRTLIAEFLDPMYPASSFRVVRPDLPFEMAATHYVGIAGIGLDAADYPANDVAFDTKRGLLSYDSSRRLKDVERGLSNTIMLIQTPYDGPAGVTPWIAGGGSTLRGVPEKDSIAPFVLGNDRTGKPITHNGKRGTYAVMADSTVRWIDAKISDAVFQAMVTVKGPVPENFSIDEWAPEVLPPKGEKQKTIGPALRKGKRK
jgi:hypothetical protein